MNAFTVYGLRIRGDKEVRYIGQTNSPENRLRGHHVRAANGHTEPLCQWVRDNQSTIEMFKIGYADTREEARGIEAAIIALCQRLDHRLFNRRPGRRTAVRGCDQLPSTSEKRAA